ncbi:MAG: hypothetical protein LUE99_00200 [Bacteroides sp.]|nr:hypothetical protein [Bacteroides sp.]
MYQKNFQITDPLPSLEEIEANYKKYGKCPTKILKGKTGITATILEQEKNDFLHISKNGYHGVRIMVHEEQDLRSIYVEECVPNRMVAWLRGQVGFLLVPLFPLIWGKQKEFYKEVEAFIKDTYHVEKTLDLNDLNVLNVFRKKAE